MIPTWLSDIMVKHFPTSLCGSQMMILSNTTLGSGSVWATIQDSLIFNFTEFAVSKEDNVKINNLVDHYFKTIMNIRKEKYRMQLRPLRGPHLNLVYSLGQGYLVKGHVS